MGRKDKQLKRQKKQKKREKAQRRPKQEKEKEPFYQSTFFTITLVILFLAALYPLFEVVEEDQFLPAFLVYLIAFLVMVIVNEKFRLIFWGLFLAFAASDDDDLDFDDD